MLPQGFCQEPVYQAAASAFPKNMVGSVIDRESLLQWGPVHARPRLELGALYDSNIDLLPPGAGGPADFILTASPGLTLGLGDFAERVGNILACDYMPTLTFYQSHEDLNSVDQHASFLGQWDAPKCRLRLVHVFQAAQARDRDVGGSASWRINTTTITGKYDYSEKTVFGFLATQSLNDWEAELNSYDEWQTQGYADWNCTPKLTAGVGIGGRWRTADASPDLTAEQITGRLSYDAGLKSAISAAFGYEFQQLSQGQAPDPTPIFSIGATYEASARTSLFLGAYRHNDTSVNPSYAGQNVTATGFSIGIIGALFAKVQARLGLGYEVIEYGADQPNLRPDRRDSYLPLRAEINCNITSGFSGGFFYTYRYNDSTVATYDFQAHQVGLRVQYFF